MNSSGDYMYVCHQDSLELSCYVEVSFLVSRRKADKVLEVVSEDKSPLRKHKVAYGQLGQSGHCTCSLIIVVA